MPAKPVFTPEQHRLIREAALRVWKGKFQGQPSAQRKMALALGVSQQTVSNLLRGTYKPGIRVAEEIAILDGKSDLEELVGVYGKAAEGTPPPPPPPPESVPTGPYANLTVCIQFHASTKTWSPWTIAAARAGFFGQSDFPAPEWAPKLDYLEKTLEKTRKMAP